LTFRSQKIDEYIVIIVHEGGKIRRPAVKTARSVPCGQAAHSGDRRDNHLFLQGLPTLQGL